MIYTHPHADHITGIDEVRILNRLVNRPLDAFATRATLDEMTRRFAYAFRPWEPPNFSARCWWPARSPPATRSTPPACTVRLFAQDHGRIQSLGLRIGAFAYSTDVVAAGRRGVRGAGKASIPGWSAASCAKARIGPTPTCRPCCTGSTACVRAARADPYGHRHGLGLAGGATCRPASRPAMTAWCWSHAGRFHGRQPGSCRMKTENKSRTFRTTRMSMRTGVPSGR